MTKSLNIIRLYCTLCIVFCRCKSSDFLDVCSALHHVCTLHVSPASTPTLAPPASLSELTRLHLKLVMNRTITRFNRNTIYARNINHSYRKAEITQSIMWAVCSASNYVTVGLEILP